MSYETIIVSVISGGLAGAVVNHILAKGREEYARKYASTIAKESRKSDFLSFMRSWRIRVVRQNARDIPRDFIDRVSLLEGEVARVLTDYDTGTLEALTKSISGMGISKIQEETPDHKEPGKEELLSNINALIDFVRTS